MSTKKPDQYHPAQPPDVQFTIPQFEQFANIVQRLLQGSGLKWWIIFAGLGAIFEMVHILWLAARYLFRF